MDKNYFDDKAEKWDAHESRVKRAEKIYLKIAEKVKIKDDENVLDFGCGTGLLGFNFIDKAKNVTFADTSKGMLEQIDKKAEQKKVKNYKTLNLTEEKITEYFNLIVTLMAMHHVEDLEKTIENLSLHLLKGGYICFSDLDLEDGSFHYPNVAPHNGIDRNIITQNLATKNVNIIYNETVHIETKTINGIIKEFPVFLIIGIKE